MSISIVLNFHSYLILFRKYWKKLLPFFMFTVKLYESLKLNLFSSMSHVNNRPYHFNPCLWLRIFNLLVEVVWSKENSSLITHEWGQKLRSFSWSIKQINQLCLNPILQTWTRSGIACWIRIKITSTTCWFLKALTKLKGVFDCRIWAN